MAIDARFEYEPDPPKLAVHLSRKISTARYESAEVSLHVSGITSATSPEALDDLIDRQGTIVYGKLREALRMAIVEARREAETGY